MPVVFENRDPGYPTLNKTLCEAVLASVYSRLSKCVTAYPIFEDYVSFISDIWWLLGNRYSANLFFWWGSQEMTVTRITFDLGLNPSYTICKLTLYKLFILPESRYPHL